MLYGCCKFDVCCTLIGSKELHIFTSQNPCLPQVLLLYHALNIYI